MGTYGYCQPKGDFMIPKPLFFFTALFALLPQTSAFAAGRENVVLDKVNALYWQDSPAAKKSSQDWDDAVTYCQTLTLDGLSNWRLPTFDELLFIVDYGRVDPAINPAFSYVLDNTYWTSTDFSATRSRAWTIDFRSGKTFYSYKTTNHAVRCVKDIATATSSAKKDHK